MGDCKSSAKWVFCLSWVAVLLLSASSWAASTPTLSSGDCIKCHADQPAKIEANGGKHKTVSCQDCHTGHRPSSKNNIPQCTMCHQGKPHFETKGCLNCHKNPHTPLSITFATKLTEPCLTCHTKQNQQLIEHKSKHSSLGCSTCHDVHRKKPECLQCHKSHSADIKTGDCRKCHAVHMPKNVMYAADTPSIFCASCHQNQNRMLTASKVKHSTFTCAFCHQDKHKMVPTCKSCHGEKHPQGIMAKFPKCGECHKIAHDLNNWSSSPAAPSAKPVKAVKKKKGK
jgi:predicted CXXCH cytochrome family protein